MTRASRSAVFLFVASPLKTGGLASAPFGDPGDIVGVISATIESKTVSIPISIR